MKTPILVLTTALALSACASADRFGATKGPSQPVPAAPSAPASAQPDPSSKQYFTEVVGDRVLFVVDSSELTNAAREVLNGQVRWLMANPDYAAVIEGHADEQGTREYNVALGARRANAVREYLIAQGIPASRLRTLSYGKERPISVCSEESCYAKNRRAVTIISAGSLS